MSIRVSLRSPRRTDAGEFLALARLSRTFYRGRAAPPHTLRAYESWCARATTPRSRIWLIVRRADQAILGSIELSQIVRGRFQSAYLGYQIGAPFAGQRYMSEALPLALRQAFGTLRLHRVEANVQLDNQASLRLVERLGFRREGYSPRYLKLGGRWRDHERWALLADEWRARPKPRRDAPSHVTRMSQTTTK
jgi:[ribosomal protein S5]-alanine N-acetyltransferase